MTKFTRIAFVTALSVATISPAFAQGAFENPPAPNSSESSPESANSAPITAGSLPRAQGLENLTVFSTSTTGQNTTAPVPAPSAVQVPGTN